jgi:hypothetical protein
VVCNRQLTQALRRQRENSMLTGSSSARAGQSPRPWRARSQKVANDVMVRRVRRVIGALALALKRSRPAITNGAGRSLEATIERLIQP